MRGGKTIGQSNSTEAGFSLLEMIAVMTILALISTITVAGLRSGKPQMSSNSAARSVAAILSRSRMRAVSNGSNVPVRIDVDKRIVTADAVAELKLPDHFNLQLTVASREVTDSVGGIVFAADGSSTGMHLVISGSTGQKSTVRTDWLTGSVTVE